MSKLPKGIKGRILVIFGLVAGLALFSGLIKSSSAVTSVRARPAQAALTLTNAALVYLLADSGMIVQEPISDVVGLEALTVSTVGDSDVATLSVPRGCEISGLHASPLGLWVAAQVNCEGGGSVFLVDIITGQVFIPPGLPETDSLFLNWTPSGEVVVRTGIVTNPEVYRVNLALGQATLLPVPWATYDLAFSPDGTHMIYSLTYGLGFGSETWIADADGQNATPVLVDPTGIIAFARWSPLGDQVAYLRMEDTNIPFSVGEVWVMDGAGQNPVSLSNQADVGHGYELIWSPDGQQLAFVGRENGDDIAADQVADFLVSNIYVTRPSDGTVTNVTQFSGALTENPAWSPDGAYLAFNTNAGDAMDVWVADMTVSQLQQVTTGLNARYPTWLLAP
jgi:Tol biopolymer transport system component